MYAGPSSGWPSDRRRPVVAVRAAGPVGVGDVAGGLLQVAGQPPPLEHLGQDVRRALHRDVGAAELGDGVVAVLRQDPVVERLRPGASDALAGARAAGSVVGRQELVEQQPAQRLRAPRVPGEERALHHLGEPGEREDRPRRVRHVGRDPRLLAFVQVPRSGMDWSFGGAGRAHDCHPRAVLRRRPIAALLAAAVVRRRGLDPRAARRRAGTGRRAAPRDVPGGPLAGRLGRLRRRSRGEGPGAVPGLPRRDGHRRRRARRRRDRGRRRVRVAAEARGVRRAGAPGRRRTASTRRSAPRSTARPCSASWGERRRARRERPGAAMPTSAPSRPSRQRANPRRLQPGGARPHGGAAAAAGGRAAHRAPGGRGRRGARPTYGPIESIGSVRDAIRAAVDKGIVVVEPAGNGNMDLADMGVSYLRARPRRATAGRSSSAPAARPGGHRALVPAPRRRLQLRQPRRPAGRRRRGRDSGYGDGLGGADDRAYTSCFDGTSSASATVAAAVAALQSAARPNAGAALTPGQVRALLLATGLPQTDRRRTASSARARRSIWRAPVWPARRRRPIRACRPPSPSAPPAAVRTGPAAPAAAREDAPPAASKVTARYAKAGGRLTIRLRGLAKGAKVTAGGRAAEGGARQGGAEGDGPGRFVVVVTPPARLRARLQPLKVVWSCRRGGPPGSSRSEGAHQPRVPGAPLNGPTTSSVIQPP